MNPEAGKQTEREKMKKDLKSKQSDKSSFILLHIPIKLRLRKTLLTSYQSKRKITEN